MTQEMANALQYYEQNPLDVKTYIENIIFSKTKENDKYVKEFLNEIKNNSQYYPNLYNKLNTEISLNNRFGGIDKNKYVEYAMCQKLLGVWDRTTGGFYEYDMPKQMQYYKINYPKIYKKCIENLFNNSETYTNILNRFQYKGVQYAPDEMKKDLYSQYMYMAAQYNVKELNNIIKFISESESAKMQQEIFEYCNQNIELAQIVKHNNVDLLNNQNYVGNHIFRQHISDHSKLGIQGWKLHIPIDNPFLYNKAIQVMDKEFKNGNLNCFKFVSPLQQYQQGQNLYGKELTVYLDTSTQLQNLSKEFKDFFEMTSSRAPKSDIPLGGLIFGRYGQYKLTYGIDTIIDQKNRKYYDDRNCNEIPAFVQEKTAEEVFNINAKIYNDYFEHKDFKRYLQNSVLGQISSQDDNYVFAERIFDASGLQQIQQNIELFNQMHPNQQIFCYQINGNCFVMTDVFNEKLLDEFQLMQGNPQLHQIEYENLTLKMPVYAMTSELGQTTKIDYGETQKLTPDMYMKQDTCR